MTPDAFLADRGKLRGADAVAAILVLEDGRYVLQLRDDVEGIFYPGHWGCFGGAVDAGEGPAQALRRELKEELELDAREFQEFTRFDFDFRHLGQGPVFRILLRSPGHLGRLFAHGAARGRRGADV